MEPARIDALARSVARKQSRLSLLAALAASLLTGAVRRTSGDAAGICVSPGRPCRTGRQCCPGSACDETGRCACAGGLTFCGRTCVEPGAFLDDPANCGACGVRCHRAICGEGQCVREHGRTCTADAQCASGQCVEGVCCDRACASPCETCTARGSVGTCVAVDGGVACEPDDRCVAGGSCAGGICVPVEPLDCDDGNMCTVDWCDPASGCLHRPDWPGTPCGDGQQCCAGACVPISRDCIRAYQLCESPEHCRARCCSGVYDEMGDGEHIVRTCARAFLGGGCGGSGLECYPGAGTCICGRCCLPQGTFARRASDCCSFVIDPGSGACR